MSVIDKTKYFEAKRKLNEFLEQHPEMKSFQKQIDEVLEKAGDNPENRLTVIFSMMMDSFRSLNSNINELNGGVQEVTSKQKDLEIA